MLYVLALDANDKITFAEPMKSSPSLSGLVHNAGVALCNCPTDFRLSNLFYITETNSDVKVGDNFDNNTMTKVAMC